jgi:hypothetical protein
VLVILSGGLGNQMFQYAAARAIASQRGCDVLIEPATGFRHDPYERHYELRAFRLISSCWAGTHPPPRRLWIEIKDRCMRKLEGTAMAVWGRYYLPALDTLSRKCDLLLAGYRQSPRYFAGIETSLRAEFQLRQNPAPAIQQLSQRLAGRESVGIHIRLRHGFSNSGRLVVSRLSGAGQRQTLLDYYRRAVALLKRELANPSWLIVSDTDPFDPAWLELPAGTPVLCGDPRRAPAEDLWLLSQTRHKIIGPSTFSWWAAWLTGGHRGLVCAPSVFLPGRTLKPSRDIYPPGWIVL